MVQPAAVEVLHDTVATASFKLQKMSNFMKSVWAKTQNVPQLDQETTTCPLKTGYTTTPATRTINAAPAIRK